MGAEIIPCSPIAGMPVMNMPVFRDLSFEKIGFNLIDIALFFFGTPCLFSSFRLRL